MQAERAGSRRKHQSQEPPTPSTHPGHLGPSASGLTERHCTGHLKSIKKCHVDRDMNNSLHRLLPRGFRDVKKNKIPCCPQKQANLRSLQNVKTGEPRTSPGATGFRPVQWLHSMVPDESKATVALAGTEAAPPPQAEPPTLPTRLNSLPPGQHPTVLLPYAPAAPSQD